MMNKIQDDFLQWMEERHWDKGGQTIKCKIIWNTWLCFTWWVCRCSFHYYWGNKERQKKDWPLWTNKDCVFNQEL